jgi:hypothetical protein
MESESRRRKARDAGFRNFRTEESAPDFAAVVQDSRYAAIGK